MENGLKKGDRCEDVGIMIYAVMLGQSLKN